MANWTEQDFHVVGSKTDIDRFIRTGFSRHGPQQTDDLLDFRKLCPLKRGEPKDTYSPDLGVVLSHFRTRTQALFAMITRWDYAPEFHARLSRHWPGLAFACSVNGEMGDFGGVIVTLNGETHNLVRDYDGDYVRRTHARDIKRVLRQWGAFLDDGRDFCLIPDKAWKHRSMPFDAHFDDDFVFFFRSREEVARFRGRYKTSGAMQRVKGVWKPIRVTGVTPAPTARAR